MRVLIACEFSGIVREAFAKRGHNAWSCDLLSTEKPGNHIQGDISTGILERRGSIHWDLMIAHPPCTYLSVSGAQWFGHPRFPDRYKQRDDARDFFMSLINADIEKICVENPIGTMSTYYRKPNQYIQPYEYGHSASKKTCLWLKGLPKLKPTKIVSKGEFVTFKSGKKMSKWYANSFGDGKKRSITYQGIADAMAEQWG